MLELHYTKIGNRFIKEAEIRKQEDDNPLATTLQRINSGETESSTQVRLAIEELFPRIPTDDLEAIVEHAWAKGTDRVGHAVELDLPRRVQLAVGARIRHTYTDYDLLLKAFSWQAARALTEPVALQKLIQWRGEDNIQEDEEFAEIAAPIIIPISDDDDDQDTRANGSEADDEDSANERANQRPFDVEVTQHMPYDTDIGGESAVEGSRRYHRPQQGSHKTQRNDNWMRQKIAQTYDMMRRGLPPPSVVLHAHASQPPPNRTFAPNSNTGTVHVPTGITGSAPTSLSSNGPVIHPVFPKAPSYTIPSLRNEMQNHEAAQPAQYMPLAQHPLHTHTVYAPPAASRQGPLYDRYGQLVPPPPPDQAVASIEHNNGQSRHPSYNVYERVHHSTQLRQSTPERELPSKRRRIDQSYQNGHVPQAQPFGEEVIDLTSPRKLPHQIAAPLRHDAWNKPPLEPQYRSTHPSPLQRTNTMAYDYGQIQPQRHYGYFPTATVPQPPSPMQTTRPVRTQMNGHHREEDDSLAYNPDKPMLQLPHQVNHLSIRPQQYEGPGQSMPAPHPSFPPAFPAPYSMQAFPPQQQFSVPAFPPPGAHGWPPAPGRPYILDFEPQQVRRTPQPVHGAPAPVQTVPRPVPPYDARSATVPPPVPPTDGAPAPTQVRQLHGVGAFW